MGDPVDEFTSQIIKIVVGNPKRYLQTSDGSPVSILDFLNKTQPKTTTKLPVGLPTPTNPRTTTPILTNPTSTSTATPTSSNVVSITSLIQNRMNLYSSNTINAPNSLDFID
jgi:hypothetical protein